MGRDKERAESRRVSAVSSVPAPVEDPLPPPPPSPPAPSRKESITIDIEAGESSDLVEEEFQRELETEVEATTEDELLKDCKRDEEREPKKTIELEEEERSEPEEDEEPVLEEDETDVVSLRGLRHSQSLPATPIRWKCTLQSGVSGFRQFLKTAPLSLQYSKDPQTREIQWSYQ